MARFLHEPVIRAKSISAGDFVEEDLPVNPLSHLNLTLTFLNNGTNTKATLANILAAITDVDIVYKGGTVQSYSLADLFALSYFLLGSHPWQTNVLNTDNAVRSISIPILFGRFPWFPRECFPATRDGDLKIQLQFASSFTNLDTVKLYLEACELLEAKPSHFLKVSTKTVTPSATGEKDISLDVGNWLAALMLYATTIPSGATATKSINWVKLLLDGQEAYFSRIYWETLHSAQGMLANPPTHFDDHIHLENTASAYTQNADTAAAEQGDHPLAHYGMLRLDPLGTGEYLLDTAGHASLKLRIDHGDTQEVRVLPLELVPIPGGGKAETPQT